MLTLGELKEQRPTRVTIDVPEWGGAVILDRLTAREQLAVAAEFETLGDGDDQAKGISAIVSLVSRSVVAESGERPFDSADGREFLKHESLPLLSRVGNEAMALHDLGTVEEESSKKNN